MRLDAARIEGEETGKDGTSGNGDSIVILRVIRAAVGFLLASTSLATAEEIVNERRSIVLRGKEATIVLDLAGGAITDFHRNDHGLNPLSWDSWSHGATPADPPPPDPRSMGHFLCLDRWGPATAAEQANGMGWHGEASVVPWKVESDATRQGDVVRAEMSAALPLAGLSVQRQVRLIVDAACFTVSEAVTNDNKLGRIYNMVQHPTIGPPFLDSTTLVDANGRRGFVQGGSLPNPEEPAVLWPQARTQNGDTVNLRHLSDHDDPKVVSYVIDDEYGWTTAGTPSRGLLIGYIWKKKDYPWFEAWRHVVDGRPFARGLEFGTTGLHQPFPVLTEKGRIFGRKLFEYIDADETQVRSYACFLFAIPKDFQGVDRISYADGLLKLHERGGGAEDGLVMEVGKLFHE